MGYDFAALESTLSIPHATGVSLKGEKINSAFANPVSVKGYRIVKIYPEDMEAFKKLHNVPLFVQHLARDGDGEISASYDNVYHVAHVYYSLKCALPRGCEKAQCAQRLLQSADVPALYTALRAIFDAESAQRIVHGVHDPRLI